MSKRIEIVSSFYDDIDEDSRLNRSRHGQLEYATTMEYIHRYAKQGAKVLEIGAGTESRKAMEESKAQADAMLQIEQGIEQISTVVQNNSATAEETSATSEELSAQATNMNELTSAFRLREM